MSNAKIHEGHLLRNAAESSTRRMSALEKRLFQTSARLAAIPDVRFFIATADLFSDLYYAPASDFALPLLQSLVEAQRGGVVGAIRNRFMEWSRQGFLSDLSHVLRANIGEGALFCVELSENGEFGKSHIHFAGALRDTPAPVQKILDRKSMRPYPDALRMLRHELPESVTMHFILRLDWRATDIQSRQIDLVQVGFVFGPTSVSALPLDVIDHLCTMSGFATLVLLTERERYFDKAIRQAARGSLVKIAPADQLKPQVEFLRRLHDSNVPDVLDSDLEATVGWFQMSKLTLPSMADLLCSTRGFQEFEVDALVRASFRHLEDTYWRGLKVNKDVPTHCAVQVAIALALDQAVTAAHTLLSRSCMNA